MYEYAVTSMPHASPLHTSGGLHGDISAAPISSGHHPQARPSTISILCATAATHITQWRLVAGNGGEGEGREQWGGKS